MAPSVLRWRRVYIAQLEATVGRLSGDLGDLRSAVSKNGLRAPRTLPGKSVAAALEAGVPVVKVERLAAAWARERGAARVAAAA